jgi:hypothetical protein
MVNQQEVEVGAVCEGLRLIGGIAVSAG